jgi:DNA-binding CsgD family transcriptional regulator
MLNKEESEILRLYILGYTINEIADEIGLSPSTVARRLKIMRLKYDNLINNGYDFPSRKNLQF